MAADKKKKKHEETPKEKETPPEEPKFEKEDENPLRPRWLAETADEEDDKDDEE